MPMNPDSEAHPYRHKAEPPPLNVCVAVLREDGRYRGIDHMRCSHPTPLPAGYHQCAGDPGCQLRLRVKRYCPYHEDLTYDLNPSDRYDALMGSETKSRMGQMHLPWQ